jgi:hypothetical protein
MNNKFELTIRNIQVIFISVLFFSSIAKATNMNGRTLLISNDDSLYCIKLQISTDTGTDQMGGATIVINYDTTQLAFPDFPVSSTDYFFNNFSGGTYSAASITKVLGNMLWLNIELNSDNQGLVVAGKDNWTDLVTIYFIKRVQSPVYSIRWETKNNFWSIYDGDNSTLWQLGIFDNTTKIQEMNTQTGDFQLLQNYPNPFNPNTTISFELKISGNVVLTVYNMLGEIIETLINSNLSAGKHNVNFDAAELSSGIYLYRLSVNNSSSVIKKMILLK